jgi:hypothetical protein
VVKIVIKNIKEPFAKKVLARNFLALPHERIAHPGPAARFQRGAPYGHSLFSANQRALQRSRDRSTPIQVKKQKKRGLDTLSRQIAPNLKFELFSEFLIFHGLGGRFFGTFSNFLSVKELL